MKMKKFWMIVCMIAAFLFLFAGCGNQASADDEKDPTTMETAEKVTEFDKDQTSLTFADIENGINFKAAGTSVTFRFEDIDSFDNSLEMQFSLSDASYEKTISLIIWKREKNTIWKYIRRNRRIRTANMKKFRRKTVVVSCS